jgi:ankyrin repeat domain-containing protein 17
MQEIQSGSASVKLQNARETLVHFVSFVLPGGDANVEDHNENGHTPLKEAASAGHCSVARILLEFVAGINTHSNGTVHTG